MGLNFRIAHTWHWDGRWGVGVRKKPLGRLSVPQSPTPLPAQVLDFAGPNIYTQASQHCIPVLLRPAKLPSPQIAKSPMPHPQTPRFSQAENTPSREPMTQRGLIRLSQELTRTSSGRVTVLGSTLRGRAPGNPGTQRPPAARMMALDF